MDQHQHIQQLIHIDQAIERHLASALDDSSISISQSLQFRNGSGENATKPVGFAAESNKDDPVGLEQEKKIEEELERIRASKLYKDMQKDLAANPPLGILQKKEKPNKQSFSLFDIMGAGGSGPGGSFSLSTLPPRGNIRDVLDCRDRVEFLSKCFEFTVQDLILGFNTTQNEVLQLSKLLYNHLLHECIGNQNEEISSSSPEKTFLTLHSEWIDKCSKDNECTAFAFLLLRNVILASGHLSQLDTSIACRFKVVKSMVKMFESIMVGLWNDTAAFQQAWSEILYLWLKCTFQLEQHQSKEGEPIVEASIPGCEIHLAWAYFDTRGRLFSLFLGCVNSTLMIQTMMNKARLVSYLIHVLSCGFSLQNHGYGDKITVDNGSIDIENAEGLVMYHSLSLLKSIIVHSSVWTFPSHRGDAIQDATCTEDAYSFELPTIETLENDFYWIQHFDQELKQLSTSKAEPPTAEDVEYLLLPFTSLLEVGARSYASKARNAAPLVKKCQKVENLHPVDSFLIDLSTLSIKHIFRSCAQNLLLLSNVMIPFLELSKGFAEESHSYSTLPDAITSYFGICKDAFTIICWEKVDNTIIWEIAVQHPIQLLNKLIGRMPRLKSGLGLEEWNKMMMVIQPILENEILLDFVGKETLKILIQDYKNTAVMKTNTGSSDDLVPFMDMVGSSKEGSNILASMNTTFEVPF